MGHGIRTVSVAERRGRLAVRHHLAPGERAVTAAAAVADIVGLHGSDPASVYLAAWARTREVDKSAIEHALYEERSLVRMLGMRRTVFVVPAESGAGDPGRLHRPGRGAPAAAAGPAGGSVGHRRRRGELAQGSRGGHGAGAGRARRRDRRGTRPGRAAAAGADHLRRDQSLRRPGQRHDAPAHVAVRRRADRARPPARRVDLQPVHLVRGPGAGPAVRCGRPRRAGPPLAVRLRPGSRVRPAVVDRPDGRAGQAGAGPARAGRGRPARRARGHARRRPARPGCARTAALGGAAARPGPHRHGLARARLVRG